MSQERKNFIARNELFTCDACGITVGPARGTFRNHCPTCLTSKHVDGNIPGDRAASCGGLMPAISIEGSDPDLLDIVQQCERCSHTRRNKVAHDDVRAAIFAVMTKRRYISSS